MVGSSPVILIYLNKQFEGVIIDKKVEREKAEAEALLHYCCRTVNYKLLFIYCQSLVFYCATGIGKWVTSDECVWFVYRHKETQSHQSTWCLGFARGDHMGHTQTHTYTQVEPQTPCTCYPHKHVADISVHIHRLLYPPGHRIRLMTALPLPHKPHETHIHTLTPTHL